MKKKVFIAAVLFILLTGLLSGYAVQAEEPLFTQEELDCIAKTGTLKVGYVADRIPISFLNQATGAFDGGTRDYNALTYKIVRWNKMIAKPDENGQTIQHTYRKTSWFWYPDNQKSIDELWQMELAKS